MDVPRRLPLTDPRRINAREKKLWIREVSYAIQEQQRIKQPGLKILCPYKLCNRGWRQEKFVGKAYRKGPLDKRKPTAETLSVSVL